MALESAQYINQLNPNNPSGADRLKDGDDHIRMIKAALLATFPGLTGPLDASVTQDLLNGMANLLVPVGLIGLWSGAESTVPAGWAIMDGRTVSRTVGTGTITVPDWRGRVPVMADATNALGATFGQTSKTYTSSAVSDHTHTATVGEAGAHAHTGKTGATILSTVHMPKHSHYTVVAGRGDGSTVVSSVLSMVAEKSTDGDSGYRLLGSATKATLSPTSEAGGNSSGAVEGHTHDISTDGAHIHAVTLAAAGSHSHTVTIDTTQPSVAVYFIMKV